MKALILLTMIFLHIVDDFYLQGILAKMKRRKGNGNYDYTAALIIHGYSWSWMVHLPFTSLMVLCDKFQHAPTLALSIILHAGLHAIIDHEKTNNHWFGLAEDQIFHIVQVVLIWATTVLALFV